MGDHFVLCVDRLITASTLESDIEARSPFQYIHPPQNGVVSTDSPSQASMGITSLDDGDLEKVPVSGILKSEDGDGGMGMLLLQWSNAAFAKMRTWIGIWSPPVPVLAV